METLKELEQNSIFILREARARFKKIAVLWSTGKDSTSVLWLCRKAFLGAVPFPVIHIDTGCKFPEIYAFRDKIASAWDLDMVVIRNEAALAKGVSYETGRLKCCDTLKTKTLKRHLAEAGYDAVIVSIRGDEHGIRAKERIFSPRDKSFHWHYMDQPPELWGERAVRSSAGSHLRVHPILEWTELDTWRYTLAENIPVNPLYFSKSGLRYRSLGCMPCTQPVRSTAATVGAIVDELRETKLSERSGRAQDKEKAFAMQKLRSLGYL
jgi:sulfate adenylyltransferase subunit 2